MVCFLSFKLVKLKAKKRKQILYGGDIMGMCKPSGGKFDIFGRRGSNIKNTEYLPNSRIDFYDEKSGDLIQQRWFGPDGIAVWDRDYIHGNGDNSHFFPHDHAWNWNNTLPRQHDVPVNSFYC